MAEKKFKRDPFNLGNKEKLFVARKKIKKVCKKNESKFRDILTSKLMSIEAKNPIEFWNLVKRMQKWGKSDSQSEDIIHPNEWLNHFQTLLNEGVEAPADLKNELEILEKEPSFSELDFRISTKEIEKALNRLNEKASPGVDKLSGKLLTLFY